MFLLPIYQQVAHPSGLISSPRILLSTANALRESNAKAQKPMPWMTARAHIKSDPFSLIEPVMVTWMSRWNGWINGDRINGLFHLLINGVYMGCNPFIRSPLILTSCPGQPSRVMKVEMATGEVVN